MEHHERSLAIGSHSPIPDHPNLVPADRLGIAGRPRTSYGALWLAARPWAWFVDRLPYLDALRRGSDGAAVRDALALVFPALSPARRERLVRATLRQRAYNAGFTLLVARAPRLTRFLARAIPRVGAERIAAAMRGGGPIIVPTFHTGPVYLLLAVLVHVFEGRTTYTMHQESGAYFEEIVRFIRALGCVSVPNSTMAARRLIRVLRNESRPVVTFACDYAPGSHTVRFFGGTLRTAEGVKTLRDAGDATVCIAIWERRGLLPRVRFIAPIEPPAQGSNEAVPIMQQVYDQLEPLVLDTPHRWIGWETYLSRAGPAPER